MTSTPSWSYDVAYYEAMVNEVILSVRADPVKGRGLFAQRKIFAGDIVHEETALCCSQNLDDVLEAIPVCGNCLVSLESTRRCVARVTQSRTLASQTPYSKLNIHRSPVKCVLADAGCPMVFCSVCCRETAWLRFHHVSCPGRMSKEGRQAYDEFLHNRWEYAGVNYSDTVYLAMRLLCMALSNSRMRHQSLSVAYRPIAQLVRAPLALFCFTYLFSSDTDDAADGNADLDARRRAQWKEFLRRKADPSSSRAVQALRAEGPPIEEFLATGLRLVGCALNFTAEERSFFTEQVWSELLGAVLLNGQERSPPSNYDRVKEIVKTLPGGMASIRAFDEQVREAGVDAGQLYHSSRGQGVYAIGCLFNHSCEPNVQVIYSARNDETLTVEALRNIEPGEELCISYIDESLPYPDRQQQLYEHYLFTCMCTKCERERLEWEESF